MNAKSLFKYIVLISLFVVAGTSQATTVHFDALPKLLKQQNLKIRGEQSFIKASKAETNHLTRSFLPTVSAYGGGETFHTLNNINRTDPIAGVKAQINLIEGGRDYLEESIRQTKLDIQKTSSNKTYLQELRRVRNIYVEALYIQELKKLYKEALYRNNSNIRMVRTKIQAGLTTKLDRIDFEIEANRLKQELMILNEEHEHTIEMLQAILNITQTQEVKLSGSLGHIHNDPLFNQDQTIDTHHDIAILNQKAKSANLAKTKEALWWSPSVDLYSSYTLNSFREREQTSQNNRDELVAGVKLSINLFDGLRSFSKSKSFSHKQKGYKLAAKQMKKELIAVKRQLHHHLKLKHNLVHTSKKMVQQSQHYLSLTKMEYELGTKNSSDVLGASQRILEQKKRYSEIRKDFLVTKNELMTMYGR